MALNERQTKFVQEYLLSGNASEAARKAGYSEKSAPHHADRMLKNDQIVEAIKKAHEERKEKFKLKEEDIIRSLIEIAFFDPMSVLDQRAGGFVFKKKLTKDAMKGANFNIYPEYQTKDDKKNGVLRARVSLQSGDRKGAIELLGKHIGMWRLNNVPDSGGDGGDRETPIQSIQRIIRENAARERQKKADSGEGST